MFPEGRAVELLIAAIVALIVVGPKDLPILLRRLGQFMAKLRGMAAEFRASFDEMARQSELDELRKEVDALRRGQIGGTVAEAGQAHNQIIDEINQGLTDVGVQLHPPMGYQYAEPTPEPTPEPPPPTTIAAAPPPKPAAKRKSAAKPKRAAAPKAAAAEAPVKKTPARKSPVKTTTAAAKPKAAAKTRGSKA
jgi:sec-independent protein translocase protein TatB